MNKYTLIGLGLLAVLCCVVSEPAPGTTHAPRRRREPVTKFTVSPFRMRRAAAVGAQARGTTFAPRRRRESDPVSKLDNTKSPFRMRRAAQAGAEQGGGSRVAMVQAVENRQRTAFRNSDNVNSHHDHKSHVERPAYYSDDGDSDEYEEEVYERPVYRRRGHGHGHGHGYRRRHYGGH